MSRYALIAAMVFPNMGGWVGSVLVSRNISKFRMPKWRPPNWVFGMIWTGLYTSMGYASYLVWRDGGGKAEYPLMLYSAQLALNWVFSPLFFEMRRMGTAMIDLGVLYCAVVANAISFYQINSTAGLLMTPYIAWLTFSTPMYYIIWKTNKDEDDKIK